jgi:tRNA (cytidine/uridine-2'-O-)-methyltransferase
MYQPDIPQNLGTLMRLGACMGIAMDVIEPCGFPLDDRKMKRAGMDYIDHIEWKRHDSWDKFWEWKEISPDKPRLVLLTTKSTLPYTQFTFQPNDLLMVGRESAGVPELVAQAADHAITIPMQGNVRSLNVAVAASMVLGEALRQIKRL